MIVIVSENSIIRRVYLLINSHKEDSTVLASVLYNIVKWENIFIYSNPFFVFIIISIRLNF